MAWIESHQSLATHRKLYALCAALNISRAEAIGHLHLLWYWALDNAPDGDLSGISDQTLAEVSGFVDGMSLRSGKRFEARCHQCGDALRSTGFIEVDTNRLHDWDDYAGRLVDQRRLSLEQRRLGGQRRMAKLSPDARRMLAEQAANARWNASSSRDTMLAEQAKMPATVPNSTLPNSTLPRTTTTPIPSPPPGESSSSSSSVTEIWRKEIGELTPAVAAELELAEARYPAQWIVEAIRQASLANQRNWRYIAGILANWRKRGEPGGAGRVGETSEELILGRYSKATAIEIAEGRHEVLPANRDLVVEELRRRGVPFAKQAPDEQARAP